MGRGRASTAAGLTERHVALWASIGLVLVPQDLSEAADAHSGAKGSVTKYMTSI